MGVRGAHGVAGVVLPRTRNNISGYWHHTPTYITRRASHISDYPYEWWLWQLTVPGNLKSLSCAIPPIGHRLCEGTEA